jgi:hypothetical protein
MTKKISPIVEDLRVLNDTAEPFVKARKQENITDKNFLFYLAEFNDEKELVLTGAQFNDEGFFTGDIREVVLRTE